MSYPTKQFVVVDPRTFDGTPFEVAERAVQQAEALAGLLHHTIQGARLMARNAQMERDLLTTGECDAPGFDKSAQGRKFSAASAAAATTKSDLKVLAAAAAYDPRKRA